MKTTVILLGYVPYKFEDKDGKTVKGTTVWFLEEKPQNDDYGQGFIPRKCTMPFEFAEDLKGVKFPYQAEPELVTRFTSKGAKAVIENFTLTVPYNFVLDKTVNK